jgi:HSP20 family protein
MIRDMQRFGQPLVDRMNEEAYVVPKVDIFEDDKELMLIADLPGVARDDIDVRIERNELVIKGKVIDELDGPILTKEFRVRDFYRSFAIPSGIDSSSVKVEVANGVLSLRLPKSDTLHSKRIVVRSS